MVNFNDIAEGAVRIFNLPVVINVIVIALIIVAIVIIVIIKRKRKRTEITSVTKEDFIPPLPISNIIKDKTRRYQEYEVNQKKLRVRIVFQDILSDKCYTAICKKKVRVGRKTGSDIRLNYPSVAAVHCFITCDNGDVCIEDNHTLNGTILNGILIKEKIPIHSNDLVLIGDREYRLKIEFMNSKI